MVQAPHPQVVPPLEGLIRAHVTQIAQLWLLVVVVLQLGHCLVGGFLAVGKPKRDQLAVRMTHTYGMAKVQLVACTVVSCQHFHPSAVSLARNNLHSAPLGLEGQERPTFQDTGTAGELQIPILSNLAAIKPS